MRFFRICIYPLTFAAQPNGKGLIPSEVDKEKLRIAEDLLSERDAEINDLRSTVAMLEAQVKGLTEQVSFASWIQPTHSHTTCRLGRQPAAFFYSRTAWRNVQVITVV